MERKEQIVPQEVMMAKQILSRLGDYSAMADEDDVISNIRDLAMLLASLGSGCCPQNKQLLVLCISVMNTYYTTFLTSSTNEISLPFYSNRSNR